MNFWRVVEILDKRKWLILLSVVATVGLTFVATRLIGYKWQAVVRLVSLAAVLAPTEDGQGQMMAVQNAKAQASVYQAMVKSQEVVTDAVKAAKVTNLPEELLRDIEVVGVGPRLYELRVSDSNPARAEAMANALAEAFVKKNGQLYTKKADDAVKLLNDQLNETNDKLRQVREKYDAYRKKNGIISDLTSHVSPAMARYQIDRQRRDQLKEDLADAQARLSEREATLRTLPERIRDTQPKQQDAIILAFSNAVAQAEAELEALRSKYTEQAFEVRQAKLKRDQLKKRLDEENLRTVDPVYKPNPEKEPLQAAIRELKQQITGYQAQLSEVEGSLKQAQLELGGFAGKDGPLMTMIADINQINDTRTQLITRLENAQLAKDAGERQNPVQILDKVGEYNPPVNVTAGRTTKLLALAALCALVGTSGLLIALDNVDRRLRSVKQAEQVLPAPVLAAIPAPLGVVTAQNLARATELHPQSLHSEAYHFLGLHLLSGTRRRIRSLMVLSAKAEQGSATTVSNLGITLAQAGQQVIIVDANIRSPQIHEIFGMSNEVGFSDLLRNPDLSVLEAALQPTTVPGLRVITSGTLSANPWELFRSQSLIEISHRLRDLADYVIYDTPSALAFTDALNLAPVVDAAYLCVRALESPTGAEQRLCRILQEENVEVIGAVLSDVPASVLDSYQHYQDYYPTIAGALPLAPEAAESNMPAPVQSWVQVGPDRHDGNGTTTV